MTRLPASARAARATSTGRRSPTWWLRASASNRWPARRACSTASKAAYLLPGTVPTPWLPYLSLSGTSMASPVVAGTVALMLQANPALTPNAVKAVLQYTAQSNPAYNRLVEGAGFLNALGAIRLARFFATPVGRLPLFDDYAAGRALWSRHILWGNRHIGGGLILPDANAWSTAVTWGAHNTDDGDNIVWGSLDDRQHRLGQQPGRRQHRLGRGPRLRQHRLGQQRRRQHRLGQQPTTTTSSGAATAATTTTSSGAATAAMTTTSSGARTATGPTATTSSGHRDHDDNIVWGRPRRRQHRLGQHDDDNIVWGSDDGERQHRLGQQRGRRHRLGQ